MADDESPSFPGRQRSQGVGDIRVAGVPHVDGLADPRTPGIAGRHLENARLQANGREEPFRKRMSMKKAVLNRRKLMTTFAVLGPMTRTPLSRARAATGPGGGGRVRRRQRPG